jgi:hypothetical protein
MTCQPAADSGPRAAAASWREMVLAGRIATLSFTHCMVTRANDAFMKRQKRST